MEEKSTLLQNNWRSDWAERLQALAATNVLFIVTIAALSVIGFAFGWRMTAWVLPLAGLIALLSLRAFNLSWRAVGMLALICVTIHAGAYLVAGHFYDNSWDGLAYHQEAALRLAAGWNPLFEQAGAYGHGQETWIQYYPKALWIGEAAVLLAGGHIEPGKLFNLTLMVAAGSQVAAALLRLSNLRVFAIMIIALVAAFNPIATSESTTFCVDGAMSSVLTVAAAALVLYIVIPRWSTLLVALAALCVAINLKFTGLLYAVVFLATTVLWVWYRNGVRNAFKLGAVTITAGAVSVFLLGYSPYVRNFREKGDFFYPLRGRESVREKVDIMTVIRPVNMADKDRFMRFLITSFSRYEYVRPPNATRLKFPFLIYPSECAFWRDAEASGFGPLYGALLVLGAAGLFMLFRNPSSRRIGVITLLLGIILLASIFAHSEGWWGRYAPQAWLLPLSVAVGCLTAPPAARAKWLGWAILALASANILFVGYYFARNEWGYSGLMRSHLREIATWHQPVTAYLGRFRSLRERLSEAGIKAQFIEQREIPNTSIKRYDLCPYDQAVCFE